jgi:hypothetical protein
MIARMKPSERQRKQEKEKERERERERERGRCSARARARAREIERYTERENEEKNVFIHTTLQSFFCFAHMAKEKFSVSTFLLFFTRKNTFLEFSASKMAKQSFR